MIRYSLVCSGAAAEERSGKAKTSRSKAATPVKPAKTAASKRAAAKVSAGCGHTFESWFQNSDAFEKQLKRGLVTCPACGSTAIEKALMAPNVKTTKGREKRVLVPSSSDKPSNAGATAGAASPSEIAPMALASLTHEQRAFIDTMRKVREHVLSNSEDVGKAFVEEARKIHHEETEARSIHGEASIEEAKALAEEGIDIFPIPVLPDDRN